jgi:hypothetical protein
MLASSGRWYNRKGYTRELADIDAEYKRRGIDTTDKSKRTGKATATPQLPLDTTPHQEMPSKAPRMAQDAPKVQNPESTTPSPEATSTDPSGWRYVLNPEGQAGWRGYHEALGTTGLYMGREGVQRAVERGVYAS